MLDEVCRTRGRVRDGGDYKRRMEGQKMDGCQRNWGGEEEEMLEWLQICARINGVSFLVGGWRVRTGQSYQA